MDPIHPILPQKPNIAPVTEPPRVGRIDRRDPREKPPGRERAQEEDVPGRSEDDEARDGEDPRPHIDVTA